VAVVLPLTHTTVDVEVVEAPDGHRLLVTVDHTKVELPPIEQLAFYAGLGLLVGVGLMEPPVAVAIGVGHALISLTNRPRLQALGRFIEDEA
jgi:hypothetical protein